MISLRFILFAFVLSFMHENSIARADENMISLTSDEFIQVISEPNKNIQEYIKITSERLINSPTRDDLTNLKNDVKWTYTIIMAVLSVIFTLFIVDMKKDIRELKTDLKNISVQLSAIQSKNST